MKPANDPSETVPKGVPRAAGLSRRAGIVLQVPLLFVIAWLDYATGYELSFFIFYFIPVALSAWCVGTAASLLTAIACTAIWHLVDFYSGHTYSVPAFAFWNVMIQLIVFSGTGLLLARIKRHLIREQDLNAQLKQSVAELEAVTARSNKLRDQFITVCAWTHRIKDEGRWLSFEEFVTKHLGVKLTHGLSDSASREMLESYEDAAQPSEPTPCACTLGSPVTKRAAEQIQHRV